MNQDETPSLSNIIGRGSYGTIYDSITHPNICTKVGNKKKAVGYCYRNNKHEFEVQKILNAHFPLNVPFPSLFRVSDDSIIYCMKKIIPPKLSDRLFQLHLGWDFSGLNEKKVLVGRSTGYKELEAEFQLNKHEYISLKGSIHCGDDAIMHICYDIGEISAIVHQSGFDGHDAEFVLGREPSEIETNLVRLYYIDFDKVEPLSIPQMIENIGIEETSHKLWVSIHQPYDAIPMPTERGFTFFKRGYLKAMENWILKGIDGQVASTLDPETIQHCATKVIQAHLSFGLSIVINEYRRLRFSKMYAFNNHCLNYVDEAIASAGLKDYNNLISVCSSHSGSLPLEAWISPEAIQYIYSQIDHSLLIQKGNKNQKLSDIVQQIEIEAKQLDDEAADSEDLPFVYSDSE